MQKKKKAHKQSKQWTDIAGHSQSIILKSIQSEISEGERPLLSLQSEPLSSHDILFFSLTSCSSRVSSFI